MEFKTEIASLNDIDGIMRLVNNAYRGETAKQGWTHEANLIEGSYRIDKLTLLKQFGKADSIILKCTDKNETIIGCVYLEKKGNTLYLGMLAVKPELQAKGIGKSLLKAADIYAKEKSCNKIEMTVISVRTELIEWYKRNGYNESGTILPFDVNPQFGVPTQRLEFCVMEKEVDS
ncbi:MAG: GNAT family N-acetyltransferase [Flavisolibacter sp.]